MRTDGRSAVVRWRDYQIFSDVKITSFLLTTVVRWRASRARAPFKPCFHESRDSSCSCGNRLNVSWIYSEILIALRFEEDYSRERNHCS